MSVLLHQSSAMKTAYFLYHITLSSVTCPAVQYFSTLYHTQKYFPPEKKNFIRHNNKRVLAFSGLVQRTSYHESTESPCKLHAVLSKQASVPSKDFRKFHQVKNFQGSPLYVGARAVPRGHLFMTKLRVAFRRFAKSA
jgi:hypothetical protein